MDLERIYVFSIDSPLTSAKRLAVETAINENSELFDREVSYRWLKRGEEKFLRIIAEPVTIEIVFHNERVELFGAAPTWACLLFTEARRTELRNRIRDVLLTAGFLTEQTV